MTAPFGPRIDEERVDLPAFAWGLGLAALGRTPGVTLLGGAADAPGGGPAPQEGHGNNGAALDEMSEDAADRRDREATPSRRGNTAILRLPHIGLSVKTWI